MVVVHFFFLISATRSSSTISRSYSLTVWFYPFLRVVVGSPPLLLPSFIFSSFVLLLETSNDERSIRSSQPALRRALGYSGANSGREKKSRVCLEKKEEKKRKRFSSLDSRLECLTAREQSQLSLSSRLPNPFWPPVG